MDGATEITPQRYAEFDKRVADLSPEVVLTQWPVDTRRDHRVCSILTLDAFLAGKRKFGLYYYEVDLGSDTQCFRPTNYVDVTATEPLKRDACMAHQSQHPENFYVKDHEPMLRFRGMESGHKAAEAINPLRSKPEQPFAASRQLGDGMWLSDGTDRSARAEAIRRSGTRGRGRLASSFSGFPARRGG